MEDWGKRFEGKGDMLPPTYLVGLPAQAGQLDSTHPPTQHGVSPSPLVG